MELRELKLKDACYMLEWMHDKNVTDNLRTDFAVKSILDCEQFIKNSMHDKENFHMCIVDGTDNYMGTVSLKHINDSIAEFAIVVRSCAMGQGYSQFGMREIIRIGISELNLTEIYWCVDKNNKRAIRFYEKYNYARTNDVPSRILALYRAEAESLIWYAVKAHY